MPVDGACGPPQLNADVRAQLSRALAARDEPAIRVAAAATACHFADRPVERPERYVRVEGSERALTNEEARSLAGPIFQQMAARAWWTERGGAPGPLRVASKYVENSLALWELTGDATYLNAAREAGDYLIDLQQELGSGGFGFPIPDPSSTRDEDRAGLGFLARARADGIYDQVVRKGWIIDDVGDGGLNYDAGLVGEALLSLYASTQDRRYLDAAVRTADWAMTRQLVPNWNYNGFTAVLLARIAKVTGDARYLQEAVVRARLGVLSGQVTEGARMGSWVDPHNGRLVYRFVMLGQLSRFINVMPADHPARAELQSGLLLGLLAAEKQMRDNGGIGNQESALSAYCSLREAPVSDPAFTTRNRDMEEALITHVIRGLRQSPPQANGEIGCLFAYSSLDGSELAPAAPR